MWCRWAKGHESALCHYCFTPTTIVRVMLNESNKTLDEIF